MAVNNLIELISQELELYRLLVAGQRDKIKLYLEGDLDRVKTSMEHDRKVLEGIRTLNRQLATELDQRALSKVAAEMETTEGRALRMKIDELRRLTSELSRINLQNYRYARSSVGFTRAMLGEIFAKEVNYNRNGYLQTGQTVVEF